MLCVSERSSFSRCRKGFTGNDLPRRVWVGFLAVPIAISIVLASLVASAQDTPARVLRLTTHLEQAPNGRQQHQLAEELRDVFPVVNVDLSTVGIPIGPDGSVPLRDLLAPMAFPAGTEDVSVRIQAGERSQTTRVRLSDIGAAEGANAAVPLYAAETPVNHLDNPGLDKYTRGFVPVGWSFDLLAGQGTFIRGVPAEPDGRAFTMELAPRPDGVDSKMWQSIPTTAVPAGGAQASGSVDALAVSPGALFLELVLIDTDQSERVLASVAHPGTGQWVTLTAKADLPAGLAQPEIHFRLRRSALAGGRAAFDNASLVIPRVFRRHANVTVASNAPTRYRTQPFTVLPGSALEFGVGVANPFKVASTQAVVFRVVMEADGQEKPIFEYTAEAATGGASSAWRDQRVDLSAWSGRSVRLVFETEHAPGQDAEAPDNAMPLWGDVVIEGDVHDGETRPPSVILISLDTLRADHLGTYGYDRETSPALDRFAESAYVFEQCFSACSWTTPAHATAFTGLLPSVHGAGIRRGEFGLRSRLPENAITFAERAQAAGYRTAAFTEGYFAGSRWGLAQGFDRYHDGSADAAPHSDAIKATMGRASAWIRESGPQPFLLFVHTYATHWPYSPPEPYRSRFLTDPNTALPEPGVALAGNLDAAGFQAMRDYYDGGIAHMDSVLGGFLAELSARGMLDNTWIILFSDHGEEFGEHGRTMHGLTLYDEVLQVPFIVRPPRGLDEPKRIADVVALADLFGTVLRILGDTEHELPPSSVSLLPLMAGGASPKEHRSTVIGELMQHQESRYFVSTRDDTYKYIARTPYGGAGAAVPGSITETELGLDIKYPIAVLELAQQAAAPAPGPVAEEMYNVRETPGESENIAGKAPSQLGILRDTLLRQLLHIRDTAAANMAPTLADPLSPEEIERLKAIGYVDEVATPKR